MAPSLPPAAPGAADGLLRPARVAYGRALMAVNALSALVRPWLTFRCAGRKLRYFCHEYNGAWANERTVEIPVVAAHLQGVDPTRVLEVGNVLSWYGVGGHVVVDKYERSPGVINVDIVDFHPAERYERIVSISTIEHIGFDEEVRDPAKLRRAVEHLVTLLAPGGRLVVTFPLAYNPEADRLWLTATDLFTTRHCLKKVSRFGFWREVSLDRIGTPRYGEPYSGGNFVAIGIREA